jgi:hypothetical protein
MLSATPWITDRTTIQNIVSATPILSATPFIIFANQLQKASNQN